MSDGFIDVWRRLIREDPGRQVEVGKGHPLTLFYGSDRGGRPLFFVICESKPGLVTLSDAVIVDRGVRTLDSRWTLSITLRDNRFADAFMRLGEDLVDSSRKGRNEAHALQLLVRTVERWKALFAYGSNQHLSLPAIRGLMGELWFGFFHLTQSVPPSTVIQAWTGPFGSPQDFNLPSGQSYEVKAIYPDAKSVRISSVEQLDPGSRSLELAVITVTDVDRSTDDAVSLPTVVERIETMLGDNVADADELHARIRALEVDIADTYYDDFWFFINACANYRVDIAFPAIRRTALNPAIDNVRYDVALHGIADFMSYTWAAGSEVTTEAHPVEDHKA
ncbi:PD-(D/E)XK motif protein [Mycobacterium sp. HUMS_1102779]|uniref:PD-(D/E)XK motif protein n=1 Tax=Mycobacterium sp. HUMS_1102779 TaxID=3383487 RepID=UPI00389A63A1